MIMSQISLNSTKISGIPHQEIPSGGPEQVKPGQQGLSELGGLKQGAPQKPLSSSNLFDTFVRSQAEQAVSKDFDQTLKGLMQLTARIDNMISGLEDGPGKGTPRQPLTTSNVFDTFARVQADPEKNKVVFQEQPQNQGQQNVPQQQTVHGQQNVQGQQGVQGGQSIQQPQNVQGQNRFNIPPFPVGGTRQEKLDYMMAQLTSPRVREEGFMDTLKQICGDNIKFAGGGQGNVVFIKGTDITLKQNLAGPEKRAYEYFDALRKLFDAPTLQNPGTVTLDTIREIRKDITNPDLKKLSDGQLLDMLKNQEAIKKGFPVPMTMISNAQNTVVAMKNVNFAQDKESKRIGEINDIKIGARIVSKHELKAHNNPEGKFPGWIAKFIGTKVIPFIKGTSSRGYEYIPDTPNMRTRISKGMDSEKILRQKFANLTNDQILSLHTQMQAVSLAHSIMPVTFMGASLMMALPDDLTTMPQACMGDFAHAMFTGEPGLGSKYYGKCNDNFADGFNSLQNLLKSVMQEKGLL